MKYWVLMGALLGVLTFTVACERTTHQATHTQTAKNYQKISGQTMGTSYHIQFQSPKDLDIQALQAQIDARLHQINKSMSTYDDTATIMQFNRAKAGEIIAIDDDFRRVLQDSRTIHQNSGGAFDPTVMPLVLLWGFGKDWSVERLQSPPDTKAQQSAQALVGLDKVIDTQDGIYKSMDGVALDFSAIAKGYGVDVIAQLLQQQGISDYMVEIGGEIATKGKNAQGGAWKIGIDAPKDKSSAQDRTILTALPLHDDYMATSGHYRNFIEYDGIRYSHAIHPKTGMPATDTALSVTVLASSTALADGWATALSVVSSAEALALAEQNNLAVLLVVVDPKNPKTPYRTLHSSAFAQKFPQYANTP